MPGALMAPPQGVPLNLYKEHLRTETPKTQEPGDGDAEGTPGIEHLDNLLADKPENWFGVADPVAEILANPALLFDLVGARFDIVNSDSGLLVGTRGRVLNLWSNAEALWVHVQLLPPDTLAAPAGCVGLTSRRVFKDDFAVPYFLRNTRPVAVAPC